MIYKPLFKHNNKVTIILKSSGHSGQGTGTKAIEVSKKGNKFVTKELWSSTEIGAKWNTPVLKDGFLFMLFLL